MTSIFRMMAAVLAMGVSPVIDDHRMLSMRPDPVPVDPRRFEGWTGNTQGSSRDVDKARRRNRLARKARRQERLHRKH